MFVSLMGDLRKAVAQFFFRAQFGQQPQQRRVQPQRLQYSGPEDAPGAQLATGAARMQPLRRQEPAQPASDEFGMARGTRTSAGPGAGGLPGGLASGPDPRTLATNRGEEDAPKKPIHVEAEPGRNDPCPCGSGKKYKKCHGR